MIQYLSTSLPRHLLLHPRALLGIYVFIAIAASIQAVLVPLHFSTGICYTDYNNYIIFRQSFFHIISGQNLYLPYASEYWDLYKYSPAFACFMGLFAHLPDAAGVMAWNVLNACVLYAAVRMLPFTVSVQNTLLLFLALELLTNIQNEQSNGILAGLIIAAYACLERGKALWATLWIVAALFIKVYGGVGFCLLLFYPGKIRFLLYALLWTILFAFIPLLVMPIDTLVWQYQNWVSMMLADQSGSYGLSVMGWLHNWFGITHGKNLVSIAGLLLFFIPFLRRSLYNTPSYKLSILAFMLVWMVIFNHKAESPTFIIAIAGIGTWNFSQPLVLWRSVLLALIFIFTCLSPTELFPTFVKDHFFIPYSVKVIPCIIAWCIMFVQLMKMKAANIPSGSLND